MLHNMKTTLTRDYYTVDDKLADYFYSEQAARQCAEKHLMRPGQYTIEVFADGQQLTTEAQRHGATTTKGAK